MDIKETEANALPAFADEPLEVAVGRVHSVRTDPLALSRCSVCLTRVLRGACRSRSTRCSCASLPSTQRTLRPSAALSPRPLCAQIRPLVRGHRAMATCLPPLTVAHRAYPGHQRPPRAQRRPRPRSCDWMAVGLVRHPTKPQWFAADHQQREFAIVVVTPTMLAWSQSTVATIGLGSHLRGEGTVAAALSSATGDVSVSLARVVCCVARTLPQVRAALCCEGRWEPQTVPAQCRSRRSTRATSSCRLPRSRAVLRVHQGRWPRACPRQ